MRSPASAVFLVALAAALGGSARAGEQDPLKAAESRADLFRAEALAAHRLFRRADAILKRLTASPVADAAKQKAAAFAAERAKADGIADAPAAYLDAIEDARRSGLPVVVAIGRKDDPNLKALKPQLDQLAARRNLIGVAVLDPGETDASSLEARLRKGLNLPTPPFLFLLSPKEEVLESASGAITAQAFSAKWQAASEKCRVDLLPVMKALGGLVEANDQMDDRHCGTAARLYRDLVADPKFPPTMVQEAKASLDAIDELAARLLKEAQAAKPAEAASYLLLLQRDFDGLKVADAARSELDKIRDAPEVKAILQASSSVVATLPGDDGEEPFRAPAKDTSKEEPAAAKETKATAPRPKVDPSASLFRVAKSLIDNKRPDRAKPVLERIVKEYPKSDAAIEARELLREMP